MSGGETHFGSGKSLVALQERETATRVENVTGARSWRTSWRGPHGGEALAGARLAPEKGVLRREGV